jgi:hypothetical protein
MANVVVNRQAHLGAFHKYNGLSSMIKWPKSGHPTAAEIKSLQWQPNLSMIDMDLKPIWEMSTNYKEMYYDNFQSGFSYTGF